jgi:UDP-glucose 4-epimerase
MISTRRLPFSFFLKQQQQAVGESVRQPLRYHQNNTTATLNLMEVTKPGSWEEFCGCGSWWWW